ncbi:unnamed protein product [Didymodactylos carnosus]|uniref:CxC5 like cysteine cluster associated with KDZ domain-containing protein n=1 Tax=Didymodactylos carnosus TaxID=1234261 RepID=A0A815YE90_9BILA|nr:unnamed protein product [Didymodactylos carnosus]CAF1569688.1 unnamed protein product [Didymodactylos carnosus]CAF4018696.1 unnamed protein product [Didymodactylos carnosus]CAF4432740.1 unnamed protein product [Didymodactylos carnosus]
MDSEPHVYEVKLSDIEYVYIKLTRKMPAKLISFIIKLDSVIPNELKTKYQHIVNMINLNSSKVYQKEDIIYIISTISSDERLKDLFDNNTNVKEIINEYRNKNNIDDTHDICLMNLLPFTDICIQCNERLTITKFRNVTLIGVDYNTPVMLFKAACKKCHADYYPNYYRDNVQKKKYVSAAVIQNCRYFYFGGTRVFDRNTFIVFTANLLKCHLTFNGYCDAYAHILKETIPFHLNDTQQLKLDPKLFQYNWFIFELLRFIFTTTQEKIFEIPTGYQTTEQPQYYRQYNDLLYSRFVLFWSHHKKISNKCNQDCSTVFLTDGHQKPNRKICNFENVCDISIPELGPCLIGCAESPVRGLSMIAIFLIIFKS